MTLLPSHTALDAPSLVFLPLAGTCFLNQSYGYAFTGISNSHRERPVRTKQDFILTEYSFCQLN